MEKLTTTQIAKTDSFEIENHIYEYLTTGNGETAQRTFEHIRAAARHEVRGKGRVSKTGIELLEAYQTMTRDNFSAFAKERFQ